MLMNLLGVPAVQQTMERMAYGEPLTTGRGMTTKPRAEAVEAAIAVAPVAGLLGKATKGLPVGASIENVGKFNVTKRDASEIFGEGAQRFKYTDPKSGGSIDVLARPDGTASVLELQVPEKFRGKGIGESLQKQVLQDFPDMQGQVSSKAAATTAYRLGRRPVDMPNATLKDVHKMIDEDSSVNLISPQMQERINPSTSYPRQEALDKAQRNAALPVEEGGLGLPKDNTPEMRAEALGVATDAYHGSKQDITGLFKAGYDDNLAFATQDPEFASKWIGKGKLTQRIGAEDEIKAAEDLYRQNKYKNTDNALLEKLQGEEFNAAYDKMSAAARAENEREFGTRGNATGLFDTVYPIKVQANKTFNPETDMDVMAEYFAANDIPPKLQDLFAGGNYMMYETKPVINYLKGKGYDSMRLRESTGDNYPTIAVFNPETVRSRFAAFDPFRINAETAAARGVAPPDILAGVLPLGLLADEEQRKKLYELVPSLLGQ
jgi:predicted GNAT family acetyltransferase